MLVVIEGIDASGKHTLAEGLLDNGAVDEVYSFPRYETPTGQLIKRLLQEPGEPDLDRAMVLQCVFTVDRLSLQPYLRTVSHRASPIVLLDRYWWSGLIYGKLDGVNFQWLLDIHRGLVQPDLWLVLDVPEQVSCRRRQERRDRYEKDTGLLARARVEYQAMAKTPGAQLLDGTKDPDALRQEAHEHIITAARLLP